MRYRLPVYERNVDSIKLSAWAIKSTVKAGTPVDVPNGRQTFGSGCYSTWVCLYAPPSHPILANIDDKGFIYVPCEPAETIETDFTVTDWHTLDTSGLEGCAIHWQRSDCIGDEPRILGERLIRIE